jgi:hypothetical protein
LAVILSEGREAAEVEGPAVVLAKSAVILSEGREAAEVEGPAVFSPNLLSSLYL